MSSLLEPFGLPTQQTSLMQCSHAPLIWTTNSTLFLKLLQTGHAQKHLAVDFSCKNMLAFKISIGPNSLLNTSWKFVWHITMHHVNHSPVKQQLKLRIFNQWELNPCQAKQIMGNRFHGSSNWFIVLAFIWIGLCWKFHNN